MSQNIDDDIEDDEIQGEDSEASLAPDHNEAMRVVEALLFASAAPLGIEELAGRVPEGADLERILDDLSAFYAVRNAHLPATRTRLTPRPA